MYAVRTHYLRAIQVLEIIAGEVEKTELKYLEKEHAKQFEV